MGCVLYEMASFRPPFMAHDIHGLKKKNHCWAFRKNSFILFTGIVKFDPVMSD